MTKDGYTYIITNTSHTVLYTGVTSNLKGRIWEHRTKVYLNSFASRYNCHKLVWYEVFSDIQSAIAREKQIKGGSRKTKLRLINRVNIEWSDLWEIVKDW